MDLGRQCTRNKSYSGSLKTSIKRSKVNQGADVSYLLFDSEVVDVQEHRSQNAANYNEKHKTSQLREEDSTHLEVRLNKNEICEEDHNLAKSGCGGSADKTTKRGPTLRELLQLPADCESPPGVVSQSKQVKHSKHREKIKLEKQKPVSKQHKWCRILKIKGLSWSCLYNPDDTENKKPQGKKKNGVFDKVTDSSERTELLKASGRIG